MKLKVLVLGLGLATFGFTSCGGGEDHSSAETETTTEEESTEEAPAEAASLTVNSDASSIVWHGDALAGAYKHSGTIAISEGTLEVANGNITGGTFTVDMSSLKATDDNYQGDKTPEGLVGHLSSGDFFEVEAHPTAKFVVSKVDGEKVMGDLTIRGTTKPATITGLTVEELEGSVTAKGNLVFDRQDFGVAYDAGKDFVISDDVQLDITVEAAK